VEVLAYIAVAALLVLVGIALDHAVTSRRLRSEVSELIERVHKGVDELLFHNSAYAVGRALEQEGGFCVWEYRGGQWTLVEDYSEHGFGPGQPPNRPDAFEGLAVRQLSVKKPPTTP
jgi:hypothetical protein